MLFPLKLMLNGEQATVVPRHKVHHGLRYTNIFGHSCILATKNMKKRDQKRSPRASKRIS